MEIYQNKILFSNLITQTSSRTGMQPAFIEKDYFAVLLLYHLSMQIPGLIFKGGTCLSKSFHLIHRFSEDIDLTLDESHFTQSRKRAANKTVIAICDRLGFPIRNRNQVINHSHSEYNCYEIIYPAIFSSVGVETFIKIEIVFIQKSYPVLTKAVSSYILDSFDDLVITGTAENDSPEIHAFPVIVQSLERTFADKVFAICDYYLNDKAYRNSRHIYDLYMIYEHLEKKDLKTLIESVRTDRQKKKSCPSAKEGISISDLLRQIIDENYYREDYQKVTSGLLNDSVTYDEAATVLYKIIADGYFE